MAVKKKVEKPKNRGGAGDGTFYDKVSKTWGFRAVRDGKDFRRKGFYTKTEAKQARIDFVSEIQAKTEEDKMPQSVNDENSKITLEEVYEHYIKYGSYEKRDATLTKQGSLWKNHIKPAFGDRPITSISSGELKNFLIQLYYQGSEFNRFEESYAYGYVEGFLKFFYLLWGYARRMQWISRDTYCVMCEDKGTKLDMPAKTKEDEDEEKIETYTQEEVKKMMERLKDTNLYTALLLGYYLGVRISECFGLMWSDIKWSEKTITIQRQMLMHSPHRTLCPCKTTAAKREIDIPEPLYMHLKEKKKVQDGNKNYYGTSYRDTECVKVRMKKGQDDDLIGGDFINRMKNGQILTPDSMKSWGVKIKEDLGIHFKYHNLRHTHASFLVAVNCPIPTLMERMGHKKIETTSKYYFGSNEIANDRLKEGLKLLEIQ
ncbi:tyrosine-type recombinase/integrase [Aminipila sp.]|uniref:tyrosine-type recombinase/integrase n=1 Tax=Aminipila sp. TaxID=2060095 RepID=UPI002898F59C|nr:tyrosine-type recombinase/integrase [Aminipila sp.]